jgi:deoxyribonuclease-4
MPRTVARRQPRRRLTWPEGAPRVGIHLGVAKGLLRAGRRARQIGATALQIFSDNPTAWRRRPEPPADAAEFVAYCAQEGIAPVAIHASYLINLAGSTEPFASQSLAGLIYEVQRAPAFGATLVNTHVGSHRGDGTNAGLTRLTANITRVLSETPGGVRLVLENAGGGGDTVGSSLEELAAILEGVSKGNERLAFCLDTAHLWGAGYDLSTEEGAIGVLDRFDALIGLDRLALVHLNDSRSALGSRSDRHEHLGAGQIGVIGLRAILRDQRLAASTALVMETPGMEDGYDVVNMRRAWLLYGGATQLPALPLKAFRVHRTKRRSVKPVSSPS